MNQTTTQVVPPWERALLAIEQRQGLIELCDPAAHGTGTSHKKAQAPLWRVRLFELEDDTFVVERPRSSVHDAPVEPGQMLLGLIIEGSSRWWFRCHVVESIRFQLNDRNTVAALRLSSPDDIHNAQRRDYFRVETAGTPLPPIDMWPLADTDSCVEFEQYNEQMHRRRIPGNDLSAPGMPQLGEHIKGRIADISGGGMGVEFPHTVEPLIRGLPALWIRANLPGLDGPLYFAARIAHYHHADPSRTLHAGVSFTFAHNPQHERFITDRVCRLTARLQRLQLQRGR